MSKQINLIGQKFGKLTVNKLTDIRDKSGRPLWEATCECGNSKLSTYDRLKYNKTSSCGCARLKSRKHGFCHSGKIHRDYSLWANMLQRCKNPNHHKYKDYGGRGIKVCDSWHNFFNFNKDMGDRPSLKHSIDRIDVNGNYEPSNCRWATADVQASNRRK